MKEQIQITVNGKPMLAVCGTALSEIVMGEKPCGGHGKCGKCKVIAVGALSEITDAERHQLSAEELAGGVRLACLTRAEGACRVETRRERATEQIVSNGVLPRFSARPAFLQYGVAVDIGTTTLVARLYDAKGSELAETSRLNPQQRWGADVISRIEAALRGEADALAKAIRHDLDEMLGELVQKANLPPKSMDGVVITGNTVMLSLLVGESVEPFSHAPFDAKRLFGETLTAETLELSNLLPTAPIYLPPCISAFVGADTTCAILATALTSGDLPVMLADIGTNGEMALWNKGRLTVCSTAAGPAFEGVGISMGMRGAEGAIDQVVLANGALLTHVIGNAAPKGICGSGLVDAVACMLETEVLDESGYLEDEPYVLQEPVALTGQDVRMLQLAKSAICAGLMTLMENGEIPTAEISALYVAGGFGNYLNPKSAARIGLLPKHLAGRAKAIGNAALSGAAMLLLNLEFRAEVETLARSAITLDLSSNPVFSDFYMSGMMLEEL